MGIETTSREPAAAEFLDHPIEAETMGDWNREMAERRAALERDVAALDAEQLQARHAELEQRITELEALQLDLFHRAPAEASGPAADVHREAITSLESQLLLLRMERGIVERRT